MWRGKAERLESRVAELEKEEESERMRVEIVKLKEEKSVKNGNPELIKRKKQSNLSKCDENAHASPGVASELPMVDTNGPAEAVTSCQVIFDRRRQKRKTQNAGTSDPVPEGGNERDLCRGLIFPAKERVGPVDACTNMLGFLSIAVPWAVAVTDKVKDMALKAEQDLRTSETKLERLDDLFNL